MVSVFAAVPLGWAGPSAVSDENFLLFLANSVDDGTGLLDPLSMSNKMENHVYSQSAVKLVKSQDNETNMSKAKQEAKNEN